MRLVPTFCLFLTCLLVFFASENGVVAKKKSYPTGSEKIVSLNDNVRDGIVRLNSESFEKFVVRPDRPYHLFLLFTAMNERYSCDVCKQIDPEFVTLAESYVSAKQIKVDTRDGLEIFFGVVDFDSNQKAFGLYDFTSAPQLIYIAPDHSVDKGARSPKKLEVLQHNMYSVYANGKEAEKINEFVKQKTGFDFVVIRSKAFLYALIGVTLVMLALVAKIVITNFEKVLAKLRRKRLWMTISLLFYGLSVSGMVYCIIRDPPPYSVERNGKIKFFHPQGRQQFVVEGLIVGGYDVTAAIFMILLSQWAIYLHKPYFRLPAIVLCFGGFFVMYKLMISCYMFKNRWYTGWMGF